MIPSTRSAGSTPSTALREGGALPIAAVERETGLSKDTLRVWERRYGFPQPGRDGAGERLYPAEQVERLRVIARLLNSGERPGQIVALPLAELRQRLQASMPMARGLALEHEALLTMLRRCEIMELRRTLNQAVMRLGLARFITEHLAPLTVHVGEAWMRGEIQVFEEHMYTESVVAVLRGALGGSAMPSPGMPRVLLGTLPQEHHLLGLLMAETMLSLEGCECVSLGANTPVAEIVRAALANRAQIVGLSFSPASNTPQLQQSLLDLRAQLPDDVQLWAGGSHPSLRKRLPVGVVAVDRLEQIPELLASWKAQAQAQAA
ncbi:MAG: cobalamin-dependent protein [Hylemonella sp.]|uniref:MerR family transcriptional regulator n=1 Tax=Hylemonella sp. TaxID=2066020 RepID=UPI0022BE6D18|nr:cobalamin-dependent protein [Hylemonella sp.]MCZ8251177.1 cobalamin-dependent protein [Hylemonella sp.]